ncbi:hypothetical protein [Crocosphaera sp. Alani8]|uniref:hypothetical protein n=1 Tax=Crocosphaera sp. Alani8 TaxID=3038952 RepID=UPI00313C2C28
MSPQFSREEIEHISEIFYLLNFFSQTQLEQWSQVPESFPPIWVETGCIHCNVDNSIRFFTYVFIGRIDLIPLFSVLNKKTKNILHDEIKVLLDYWMTEFYDFIFLKREELELSDIDKIWLILSRLCKIALSYEDWKRYPINELSFEYFLAKYTHPYDPI